MGPDRVILDSPPRFIDSVTVAFTVEKGDRVAFILSHSLSTDRLPRRLSIDPLLEKTEKAWIGWIGRFDVPCRWPDAVKRSLLTLRTLTDRKSGGIVAAATLGLPELPGSSLNWNYRYCWLRDSTFTLTALVNAGLHEEARSWRDWSLRAVGGEPSTMQIVQDRWATTSARARTRRLARLSGCEADQDRQRRVSASFSSTFSASSWTASIRSLRPESHGRRG
jgi:GH15 family glucan-1,4-alpha-glucosidase